MNISSVNFNSAKNTNFGLITRKAYQKIMDMEGKSFNKDDVKYPVKIQKDKDFILHYSIKEDLFQLYPIKYQASFVIDNPQYKFSKAEFAKQITDKMTEIKKIFKVLPLRDKELDVKEVKQYL